MNTVPTVPPCRPPAATRSQHPAGNRVTFVLCLCGVVCSHLVSGAGARPTRAEETPSAGSSVRGGHYDPLDWNSWRGPRYDGVSPETGLIDNFDPKGGDGSNVVWKREDLGTRSTPIVMGGKLYALARADRGTDREGERVVCVDAATGKTLWEHRFNVWLSDVPDTRVGWSSVVGDPETGNVYALGVCGYFQCLEGDTGETLWSVPMHEFFGMLTTYGGRTNFPVICDDAVIVGGVMTNWGDMSKPAHRLVAFDKRTGEIIWFNGTTIGPYDTNYSSPTVTVIGGQKVLVFGSGDGRVWAFEPRTGRPIWNDEISRRGLNIAPLVVGDTVFMGHSEENEVGTAMGTMLAIDGTGRGDISRTGEKWRVFELMVGKSSPVLVGDKLYCVDDRAKLHILDAATGAAAAKRPIALGRMMRGSPLVADGKLYVAAHSGDWFIFRIDEQGGLKPVSKGRFPRGEDIDASPICSHGSVYFTTSGGIYCLRDPNKTPGADPVPPQPQERPVEEDLQGAYVQIVPAELLMQPGEKHTFQARLYNARGQFLKETTVLKKSTAQFSVSGAGTIDNDGHFRANDDAAHQSAIVSATVGSLVGKARVRMVPALPWEFTFENLSDPPVTWVGARYRHVIREVDGNPAMIKITTIPKGTRSRCWFGPSDLSDYTVEADVRGAIMDDKMPDIGIIAQGYALDLQGASQKLQIRTWSPQLRMAKTIDFPWKPNTWYVMQLRAENENGQAVLRGKVWPRGQQEPSEWTIEAIDNSPNVAGSPGLYGNAKDAEITLDNIKVHAN